MKSEENKLRSGARWLTLGCETLISLPFFFCPLCAFALNANEDPFSMTVCVFFFLLFWCFFAYSVAYAFADVEALKGKSFLYWPILLFFVLSFCAIIFSFLGLSAILSSHDKFSTVWSMTLLCSLYVMLRHIDGHRRCGEHKHLRGKWSSDETYDGNWKDGLRHGRGLHTAANGNTYLGEWHKGRADGWGVRRLGGGGCGNSEVQHQMGSSLPQFEHHLQIEKLKQELSKEKSDFKAKLEEEMRAAENEALAERLKELTDLKATLAKKLYESDDACKKLLGQTPTVGNSEAEIQDPSQHQHQDWRTASLFHHHKKNDRILMKALPAVHFSEQPQFQLEHTFAPPFQSLIALSDTLAQLQRCQFQECGKLADKHTVLSKELPEQVSIGGTLQKAIEDTQRECSELQREFKGKWKLQRGLEGDEKFIGMPGVWSMLSELLPQAQQAMFDLMVSRHSPEAVASHTAATLPGCTGTNLSCIEQQQP
ncbi:hypothetical protein Pelo_17341 [Pelomyxa schiedti]|nr:hypothetical protein Pelo_17341 [Pelomyxa schiedti]